MESSQVIQDQTIITQSGRSLFRASVNLTASLSKPTMFGTEKPIAFQITEINPDSAKGETTQPLNIGQWLTLKRSEPVDPAVGSYFPPQWLRKTQINAKVMDEVTIDKMADDTVRYIYHLDFANTWKDRLKFGLYRFNPIIVWALFIVGLFNVVYLKSFNITYFWYKPILNIYSITISFYILSRFFLSVFYKPPQDVGYLPKISVIIACKNEEDSIRKTIDHIYASDYPQDLMEVITINDGSTDGTLREMRLAARIYPHLMIINFKKNLGKRHGMAAGARRAKGDILVYIDSDSFVKKTTLRKIVRGFSNPKVGAVCGHANVANATENMLTKMQQVRYFVAFRVLKSSESLFWAVSCCSGCLAAYRRSYVMDILDIWLNQKFLGIEATFGDDRSLTNFMLRRYRVLYDSEAVCSTLVPSTYRVFFRQQLRWKKSWIRETFIASRFMWKRHPLAAFFFYMGAVFPMIAPFIVINALVLPLFVFQPISFLYVYGAFLMACLYSLVYLGYFRDGIWVYGILFSFFYMIVLVWQTYYALLTVRQNHWGTR